MKNIESKIRKFIEEENIVELSSLLKNNGFKPEDIPTFGNESYFRNVGCLSYEDMEELLEHFYS